MEDCFAQVATFPSDHLRSAVPEATLSPELFKAFQTTFVDSSWAFSASREQMHFGALNNFPGGTASDKSESPGQKEIGFATSIISHFH